MVKQVYGSDLKIGDRIEVWWFRGDVGATCLDFRPHTDPTGLFPDGARIGKFTANTPSGSLEMTIPNTGRYALRA